jgi:hypothetical protein
LTNPVNKLNELHSGLQRIRQRAWQRVDAEALSHPQGTPEDEKELQQTATVL